MLESLQLPNKKQHLPSSESTIITSITSSPTARHVSIWPKSWGGSDLVATRALPWAIGPTYTPKLETASATTLLVVLSKVVISPWRQFEAIFNLILLFSTCIARCRLAKKKKRRSVGPEVGSNGVKPRLVMSGSSVKLSWSTSSMSLSALVQLLELSATWGVDIPIILINFGILEKKRKTKSIKQLVFRCSIGVYHQDTTLLINLAGFTMKHYKSACCMF